MYIVNIYDQNNKSSYNHPYYIDYLHIVINQNAIKLTFKTITKTLIKNLQ